MTHTTEPVISEIVRDCRAAASMLQTISLTCDAEDRDRLTRFCARRNLYGRIIDTQHEELIKTFLPKLKPYVTYWDAGRYKPEIAYAFTRLNPFLLTGGEIERMGIVRPYLMRNPDLSRTKVFDLYGRLVDKHSRFGASMLHPMHAEQNRFYYELIECPDWQRLSPFYLFHAQAWAQRQYAAILQANNFVFCPIMRIPVEQMLSHNIEAPNPPAKPPVAKPNHPPHARDLPLSCSAFIVHAWRRLTTSNGFPVSISLAECNNRLSIMLPYYDRMDDDYEQFICRIVHRDHALYADVDSRGDLRRSAFLRVGIFTRILYDEIYANFPLVHNPILFHEHVAQYFDLPEITLRYDEATYVRGRGRPPAALPELLAQRVPGVPAGMGQPPSLTPTERVRLAKERARAATGTSPTTSDTTT